MQTIKTHIQKIKQELIEKYNKKYEKYGYKDDEVISFIFFDFIALFVLIYFILFLIVSILKYFF